MRRIGTLSSKTHAETFRDYLTTLSIESSVDDDTKDGKPVWAIWIREEKDLERAREEFAMFRDAPSEPKYKVHKEAESIRDERIAEEKRRLQYQQSFKPKSGGPHTSGPLAGLTTRQNRIPVTVALIAISVIVFCLDFNSSTKTLKAEVQAKLKFVDMSDYHSSGGDAFASLRKGEYWRLVTPMFVHGGPFHIAFNMIWIFSLGAVIERIHGSLFYAVLVFAFDIAGTMMQVMLPPASELPGFLEALAGSPFSIGASGAVYGLFGFLWIRPLLDLDYPIHMIPTNVAIMLGWLVICMTPMIPNVANGAHVGGLLAGMLAAYLSTLGKPAPKA